MPKKMLDGNLSRECGAAGAGCRAILRNQGRMSMRYTLPYTVLRDIDPVVKPFAIRAIQMTPAIFKANPRRAFVAAFSLALAITAHAAPAKVSQLTERFAVAGQITPDQVADLKSHGYTTLIALRPDGEGPDQPSAAQMEAAARSNGMAFAYVPVKAGAPSPDSAVTSLSKAIADKPGKVLLYCRSGSRAARTWGLVEASRPGGADANTIIDAVKASGQSAEDLRDAITKRVSLRPAR